MTKRGGALLFTKLALVGASVLGTLLGWAQISATAAPEPSLSARAAPTPAPAAPSSAPKQLNTTRRNVQTAPAPMARTRSSR